ncbi:MAG: cation-translocating P-type ATPase [Clostridia bacterium]
MKENGLTSKEVSERLSKFGRNELTPPKKQTFIKKVFDVLKEPMFLLLIAASVIYLLLGEPRDGFIMLVFVVGVISIEIIQEWKTDKTLAALKELSATKVSCKRDGETVLINSEELVPDDIVLLTEGDKIPADGVIIIANDLAVDESSLTGEPIAIFKTAILDTDDKSYFKNNYCYGGTVVTGGSATIKITKTGSHTEYGKIGTGVALAPIEKTPLQKQTDHLVKICAIFALVLFIIVCGITFLNLSGFEIKNRVINSILSGITLSMAMIPEEFPVILTVFLSMGAWRLARKNSLIRRLPSVETLGAVSVLCVDKTGTLTKNEMTVSKAITYSDSPDNIIKIMALACETEAYDPMEKAMVAYANENNIDTTAIFKNQFIKEYPFTNENKMMGHIWKINDDMILAAKGSSEMILPLCNLSPSSMSKASETVLEMAESGLRVIAVATASYKNETEICDNLKDCSLKLCGFIGLSDPPRDNVYENIQKCYKAGVKVVMITGDNGITASAIANEVGLLKSGQIITGAQIDTMTDEELRVAVRSTTIFSRVIPSHKMRIVKAFKANGEIVAMTGDGVNDAPALKYADIGIAMGKRGSQISREASDMVLLDDNFSTIVETIQDGRRIYDNIRKAINYVFTIHIPIALSALLAPLLGIAPEYLLLLPLHVVILELVIDPTCSIVFERIPKESDIMDRPPRNSKESVLTKSNFIKSVVQGLVIFVCSFGTYLSLYQTNVATARTMGICIILIANLVLVFVNSSNIDSILYAFKNLTKDKVVAIVSLIVLAGIGIILYTPLNSFLKLAPLTITELLLSVLIGILSVIWYELVKLFKSHTLKSKTLKK